MQAGHRWEHWRRVRFDDGVTCIVDSTMARLLGAAGSARARGDEDDDEGEEDREEDNDDDGNDVEYEAAACHNGDGDRRRTTNDAIWARAFANLAVCYEGAVLSICHEVLPRARSRLYGASLPGQNMIVQNDSAAPSYVARGRVLLLPTASRAQCCQAIDQHSRTPTR